MTFENWTLTKFIRVGLFLVAAILFLLFSFNVTIFSGLNQQMIPLALVAFGLMLLP